MIRHVYKNNVIVEYPDGDFVAFAYSDFDSADDINTKTFRSLKDAKKYIDSVTQ